MEMCSKILIHTTNNEENLVFNGYTGELDIVNQRIAKFLEKKNQDNYLNDIEINQLKESYYLVEDEKELINSIYLKYSNFIKDNMIEKDTYVICPTLDCNLFCSYCYEKSNCNRNYKINDLSLIPILKFINEYTISRNRKGHIALFGGEPLLSSNVTINRKIFEFARENNFTCDITTNGTTINLNEIFSIIKENANIISSIQVSIDGTKDYHDSIKYLSDGFGTFELVITNITKLLELGINTNIRINISKKNLDEISKIHDFFQNSQLVYFDKFNYYFAPITNNENMNETDIIDEADLLIKLEELNLIDKCQLPLLGYLTSAIFESECIRLPAFKRCDANRSNYFIFSPDGYVYSCPELIGDVQYAKMKFFPEYEKLNVKETYEYENILETAKLECKNCNIVLLCGGGCILAKNCCIDYCKKQKEVVNKYMNHLRKVLDLK